MGDPKLDPWSSRLRKMFLIMRTLFSSLVIILQWVWQASHRPEAYDQGTENIGRNIPGEAREIAQR